MSQDPRTLVVGLGSPVRGDDGVGPEVAQHLQESGVDIEATADPSALIDLLDGRDHVIVVDAMRSGSPPGTVSVMLTGTGRPPLPTGPRAGPTSTHGIDLAAALELARALGRLPADVAVVAIEGGCFDPGAALSDPVRSSIPVAVEAVRTLLGPRNRR